MRSALHGTPFRRDALDVAHLAAYHEDSRSPGPIQREEALALFGLLRVVRPRTVVEFGFLEGRSAFNLLRALDDDALLVSYDVEEWSEQVAADLFGRDPRFRFVRKSQADFAPADVDGRPVDFVLLDASHDLALNQATFRALEPALAEDAIVAVHDTGTLRPAALSAEQLAEIERSWSHRWVADGAFEHTPGERATVNWVREAFPEFAQIHLHTHRVPRWGLTLLQRSRALPTSGGP